MMPPFQNYDEMFAEEAVKIATPVISESSVVIIVLGVSLGIVISAIVLFVGVRKCRAVRTNAARNECCSLITNDAPEGYQSINGNHVGA